MGHLITDCSRDGKWFLTTLMASKLTNWMTNSELYLVKWDGSDAKKIGQGFDGKLSPDGKTVLCLDLAWKDEVLFTHLVLVDVKSGERRRISRETNGTLVGGYCWSPDGKKIAYVWQRNPADGEKEYEFFLMVMDADGQNSTVVLSQKTSDRYVPFGSPDWR